MQGVRQAVLSHQRHDLPQPEAAVRDYLLAIAIFVNGAKGMAALELGRDMDVSYKTAYVLSHKLREAMSADQRDRRCQGRGGDRRRYFGGHVKPANHKENRRDRRLAENQSGKREVVVAMRERGGKTLPFVAKSEAEAVDDHPQRVPRARRVRRRGRVLGRPACPYDAKRINHSFSFSDDGACTNQVENFFSRLRRAEIGQHHHISGPYLKFYAGEMGLA